MHLDRPFYKLALRVDAARLGAEVAQFSEADWRGHPQGYGGNSALILVSQNGGQNDAFEGPMKPTEHLAKTPYIRQVLGARCV